MSVCNNFSSLTTNTLYCTLDRNLSGSYYASFWIDTNTNYSFMPVSNMEIDFSDVASKMGKTGLFLAFFIILVFALMGIYMSPSTGIIIGGYLLFKMRT